jgi:phosphatidylglycerophosphate synthase
MLYLNQYRSSLKTIEAEEIVDLLFFRPLAFLFVKVIYSTSLTPNQITLISMLFGIAAGVSFGIGGAEAVFLGGILIALNAIFDCADGQLARLKSGTFYGRLLDGIVDYVSTIAVFIGIGFWGAAAWGDPLQWWVIVCVTGIAYALQAGLVDYYRSEYIANAQGRSDFVASELSTFQQNYNALKAGGGDLLKRLMLALYIKYSRIQSVQRDERASERIPPNEYVRTNRLLIRLWNVNGTSTHTFVLAVLALMNQLDWYIWYILVIGNLWTLGMMIIQKMNRRELLLLGKGQG